MITSPGERQQMIDFPRMSEEVAPVVPRHDALTMARMARGPFDQNVAVASIISVKRINFDPVERRPLPSRTIIIEIERNAKQYIDIAGVELACNETSVDPQVSYDVVVSQFAQDRQEILKYLAGH
jgi:hypothetical protein